MTKKQTTLKTSSFFSFVFPVRCSLDIWINLLTYNKRTSTRHERKQTDLGFLLAFKLWNKAYYDRTEIYPYYNKIFPCQNVVYHLISISSSKFYCDQRRSFLLQDITRHDKAQRLSLVFHKVPCTVIISWHRLWKNTADNHIKLIRNRNGSFFQFVTAAKSSISKMQHML